MGDETQTTQTLVDKLKPSTSTVQSTVIGLPITVIFLWIIKQIWPSLEIPAEVAGSIGTLISTFSGYGFSGGKSNDVA